MLTAGHAASMAGDPIPDIPMAHTVLGAMDFGGRVRMPRGDYESAMVVESFSSVDPRTN